MTECKTDADKIIEDLRYLNHYTGHSKVLETAEAAADYIETLVNSYIELQAAFDIYKRKIELIQEAIR